MEQPLDSTNPNENWGDSPVWTPRLPLDRGDKFFAIRQERDGAALISINDQACSNLLKLNIADQSTTANKNFNPLAGEDQKLIGPWFNSYA